MNQYKYFETECRNKITHSKGLGAIKVKFDPIKNSGVVEEISVWAGSFWWLYDCGYKKGDSVVGVEFVDSEDDLT